MLKRRWCRVGFVTFVVVGALAAVAVAQASEQPFLKRFSHIDQIASTVPSNGDVNPYGVAVVPHTVGNLTRGDVLVSNFNDSANAQGTGTTIVEISRDGTVRLFAQIDASKLPGRCPGGIGLTTALGVLHSGLVIVGSLPTTDGTSTTAQAGCLLILNSSGRVVKTISGNPINGPWDMATVDQGDDAVLFVTNVLNGTVMPSADPTQPGPVVNRGSVVRIQLEQLERHDGPRVASERVIASGFAERTDPAALVVGPTGLGVGEDGTLYVADTVNGRIASIQDAFERTRDAGAGRTVSMDRNLNGPLGLAIAPNEDILTANAGDGNLVETTPGGRQVATKTVDTNGTPVPGAGDLFGITIAQDGHGVLFVDDFTNSLNLLH
jgi:hypothetical protein